MSWPILNNPKWVNQPIAKKTHLLGGLIHLDYTMKLRWVSPVHPFIK